MMRYVILLVVGVAWEFVGIPNLLRYRKRDREQPSDLWRRLVILGWVSVISGIALILLACYCIIFP